MCLFMYSSHLAVCNLAQAVLFIESPNTENGVGRGVSQRTAQMNPPEQAVLSGLVHCIGLAHRVIK